MPKRIRVAKKEDIPEGKAKLLFFQGREVALFRMGDEFFALDNRCPHQGGPLGEGHLDGESVICPWHHWDFHLKTGQSRIGPEVCVKTYLVELENEEIYLVDQKSN